MTLIKTSLLNTLAVVIKMLTMLGLNKVLAIYVGPAGYAAIGQFQNAVQMITVLASGAINTGVVKYTAEYYDDTAKQHAVWRTAGMLALIGSTSSALLILIFNRFLAKWILNDENLGSVFVWLASTLILFVLNALFLAVINGKKEINKYVIANIAGSIFALIVSGLMAFYLGLYGALVALAIYQSLTFFVTCALLYKTKWFRFKYFIGKIDEEALKNLSKYIAMAVTTAACVPLSHILVRNYMTDSLGVEAAGYWEAMWRLSGAYLMVATTVLSVYYLPKMAEIKTKIGIKLEIISGYILLMPIVCIAALVVYFMQDLIIVLLFTQDFAPMKELFMWQLIGDVLKVASWIMGFVLAAKAYYRWHIFSQVVFTYFFYILVILMVDNYGLEGVAIAHAANYLMFCLFLYFLLRKKGYL